MVETTVTGDGKGGTRLFIALGDDAARRSTARGSRGVLILSDGQVHDVPKNLDLLGIDAPLHLLLTGQHDERDRRLVVEQVPNYGMVGDHAGDHAAGRRSAEGRLERADRRVTFARTAR